LESQHNLLSEQINNLEQVGAVMKSFLGNVRAGRQGVMGLLLAVAVSVSLSPVRAANRAPVGGGTTRAGLDGEYFANPNFEGKPAFTRRDVRINFDWKEGVAGKGLPVGGAATPGMADFPHDDFSIRWTGAVVPRFSETYIFRVTGKDGVRFKLGGKVLVASLDKGVVQEVKVLMKKSEKVDLVFEYVDRAGTDASEARLEWSSPSTPWEVIEPLSFAQICGHQAAPQTWNVRERADMKREVSRWRVPSEKDWKKNEILTDEDMDKNGWPTVPTFLLELQHQNTGRHMVRFQGKAAVEVASYWHGSALKVSWNTAADGSGEPLSVKNSKGKYGLALLPKGVGYSAKDNTTTAWFDLGGVPSGLMLIFTDAERSPGKPGVASLQVMSPVAKDSTETHQPGEITKREARTTFNDFIVNRLHIGMSLSKGWTWQDRTLPGYQAREHAKGWGYCLEEYIMLVNESGMDWHICCGAGWDQDFMRKFALMTRYGSDGVNPYTRYVENPKYPPLNPNLRIYLEHSNELPWAVYPGFIWDDLRKKVAQNHADWKLINYDGKLKGADGGAMFRYHALRMKQISDAFRTVYIDVPGAMGDRARVYCFGQYTAPHMNYMLQFLDNYFNKADPASTYAGEPHPPSYYIWGGGGAIYYGCSNKFGLMEKELLVNGGFEDVDVPTGTAQLRPTNTGWTFTGNAGVCDVRMPSNEAAKVKALPAQPAPVPTKNQWVGFKFTVGKKDLYVYKMGRWVSKGQTSTNFWRSSALTMAIYDEGGARMAGFRSYPRLSTFKPDQFAYDWCSERASGKSKTLPAYLQAGKTYYLVSSEKAGNKTDRFFGPTDVTAAPGLTIDAAVTSTDGKKWQETPGSRSFGPVNMAFTTETLATADGNVGVPPDCSEAIFFNSWNPKPLKSNFKFGAQCAFLQGEGSMSREFTVEKAGAYWITFNPGMDRLSNGYKKQNWGGWTVSRGWNTLRAKIDDEDVTPGLLPRGGYEGRGKVFHYAATAMFKLQPGKHTVTFERVNAGDSSIFIDEVHLSSEDAFYGGPESPNFPSGGNALGQNAATGYHLTAQAECEMAQNWGLVPGTYEGGWAVQGDFDHYSMLAWNDLRYGSKAANPELTKQALRNAFNTWCEKGGYVYAYFYPVQKDIAQTDAPLLECVREMNDRLSIPPAAGLILPGTLTPEQSHSQGGADYRYSTSWTKKKTPADLPAHSWKSWIVTSGKTVEYKITLKATGGKCELRVDDVKVAEGDATAGLTATVKLIAGVHAVKVLSLEGAVKIESIELK
jgi:PA14 domain